MSLEYIAGLLMSCKHYVYTQSINILQLCTHACVYQLVRWQSARSIQLHLLLLLLPPTCLLTIGLHPSRSAVYHSTKTPLLSNAQFPIVAICMHVTIMMITQHTVGAPSVSTDVSAT